MNQSIFTPEITLGVRDDLRERLLDEYDKLYAEATRRGMFLEPCRVNFDFETDNHSLRLVFTVSQLKKGAA